MAKMPAIRFAVGTATGSRSRAWRLWVTGNHVYVSGRTLGASVKVSLHEPGPSRFALTKEWVQKRGFVAPAGKDARLAVEWTRPRVGKTQPVVRPLSILVPYDEVLQRGRIETGNIVWIPTPPDGACVHFDVVYVSAGVQTTGHPGARKMKSKFVGRVVLPNGQTVFVVAVIHPISDGLRQNMARLKSLPLVDKNGQPLKRTGNALLSFGTESNADTTDGSRVGVLLDLTRN